MEMSRNGSSLPTTSCAQLLTVDPQRKSSRPEWVELVLVIAQDKKHELPPAVLRFWKAKLEPFRDEAICQALLSGRWKFFPSVDEVIDLIEEQEECNRLQVEEEREKWAEHQRWVEAQRILEARERGELFGIADVMPIFRKIV